MQGERIIGLEVAVQKAHMDRIDICLVGLVVIAFLEHIIDGVLGFFHIEIFLCRKFRRRAGAHTGEDGAAGFVGGIRKLTYFALN